MTPPPASTLRAIETFDDAAAAPAREAPRLRSVPTVRPDAAPQPDDAGAIWRDGGFQADAWTTTAADEAVAEGPAILPLSRFLAERDALVARTAPLGVVVQPGEPIEELVPHLACVTLVVLPFPKFSDGRSMSTARLLRERHGFTGEIRASGDVLIDQMPLMRRCGFSTFEVANPVTRKQLKAGKWPDVALYLQPTGDAGHLEVPAGTRPWARRLARDAA